MDSNTAYRAARRSNFNTFVITFIALVILMIVGALSTVPFFLARVTGPHELAQIEVLRSSGDDTRYWVTITGDDYVDTGYYYSETETLEGAARNYGALLIRNKYLLVEQIGTVDEDQRSFTGHLMPISSEVRDEVISKIIAEVPNAEGSFLPLMLVTYQNQWYAGGAVWALLMIIAMYVMARTILRYINPAYHPILKDMALQGPPDRIMSEIVSDLNVNGTDMGKMHFGRQWMAFSDRADFRALPYRNMMWAHKYTLNNKRYGITVSKQHSAQIYDRDGKMRQFTGKEQQVDEWLAEIARRSPATVTGWNQEIADYWKKSPKQFVAEVDARRNSPAAPTS